MKHKNLENNIIIIKGSKGRGGSLFAVWWAYMAKKIGLKIVCDGGKDEIHRNKT